LYDLSLVCGNFFTSDYLCGFGFILTILTYCLYIFMWPLARLFFEMLIEEPITLHCFVVMQSVRKLLWSSVLYSVTNLLIVFIDRQRKRYIRIWKTCWMQMAHVSVVTQHWSRERLECVLEKF